MLDGLSTYAGAFSETNDGGYVFSGYADDGSTSVSQNTNYDGVLTKCNSEGEVQWFYSFGGMQNDEVNSVIQMNDGSYRLVGRFNSTSIKFDNSEIVNNNEKYDGMLIKFEETNISSMYVKQAKSINNLSTDVVSACNDGGYIVGGSFYRDVNLENGDILTNLGKYSEDAAIIKYDSLGSMEWVRHIGGNESEYVRSIIQCNDGGYVVTGEYDSTEIDLENNIKLKNLKEGSSDIFIIKYTFDGIVEWARSIGGNGREYNTSVTMTSDNGYIVAGDFESNRIDVVDKITLYNTGSRNGMIIKYSSNGAVEWAQSVNGSNNVYIKSVASTSDDGYIIGGIFNDTLELGKGSTLESKDSNFDGFVIKYNKEGEIQWSKQIGSNAWEEVDAVIQDNDGNYVVCGNFNSDNIELGNGINLSQNSYESGMIIKYNSFGNVLWARAIEGTGRTELQAISKCSQGGYIIVGHMQGGTILLDNNEHITARHAGWGTNGIVLKVDVYGNTEWGYGTEGEGNRDSFNDVVETNDGNYLLVGKYYNSRLVFDNNIFENFDSSYCGMLVKMNSKIGMSEVQELEVENTRKEFKITTEVKKIDNVKGGTISGEYLDVYETVKYGDSSTKEIKMTPDENYEIVGININGVDYPVDDLPDGEYVLPNFDNVTEDKHVVVTFALKENKLIINKVDKDTKEKLAGATFKLDQVEERAEPNKDEILGDLTDNGKEYTEVVVGDEVVGNIGELTRNGAYYFVQNDDGTYTPTNSKTYQVANGKTTGIQNVTANSYMMIDLTGMTGQYAVEINARCSSENSDHGYATITESIAAPSYRDTTGKFMDVSGTKENTNYISGILEGGKIYYLHLGYYKDGNTDTNEDQVVINRVKLYNATTTIKIYNFINNNGKYESTNQGKDNTESCSYIPLDLRNYTGKYNLIINAEMSCKNWNCGEIYITNGTTIPDYGYSANRELQIYGEKAAQDYTFEILGGKMYYIHFRYHKDSSGSSGEDKFIINSVNIELNGSELYHTTVETNSLGQGITQVPFGRYSVTEVKAPDGYVLNETPIFIDFKNTEDINHEFTIENEATAKLVVHHYLKGTTIKVAEDENYIGVANDEYKTTPRMDLKDYELEKDESGQLVLPENAIGTYKSGTTEVTYYYVEKPALVIVHHYYEGTKNKLVDDIIKNGKEGEAYTTEPLTDDLFSGYVVVNTPDNSNGVFERGTIEVTYYYAKKKVPLTVNKIDDDGNPVSGATFKIYNKYENVLASNEFINNGLMYEVPDKSTELELNKKHLTRAEYDEVYGYEDSEQWYTEFVEKDGKYESTMGYDKDGNLLVTSGAWEIDLTNTVGKKMVVIEAETNQGSARMRIQLDDEWNQFGEMYDINGTQTFSEALESGKKYYLTVDYYDNDNNGGYCRINSIKVYEIKNKQFGFGKNEFGEYVSNNKGVLNTTASSYMLIDLSDKAGFYKLNIESTLPGLGAARIDLYDKNHEYLKNIVNIDDRSSYNDEEVVPIYNSNSELLQGGNTYILEFKYIKGNEGEVDDVDSDEFIINKVLFELSADMAGETDNSGKVTFMVEPGEYDILESNVPNGYEAPENTKQRITVGEDGATITVVNRKHKGTVTVHHYIEGTTTPIPLKNETVAQDEVLRGDEGEEYLTKEINDDKSMYTVSEVPKNASGKYIDGNIEVTYYYRLKDTSVITHYYEEGTTNKISEDKVINGRINDEYVTAIADDIPSKYELVATPANATGTMTEDTIEVIYYFRKKATQVIVRHYEEGTTVKLSEDVTIDGRVDDPYTTVAATDVPIKYELSVTPANANGTMTEDTIEVIYYYRVKDAVLNIRYLEKNTNIELAQPEQQHGKVDEEYITGAKTIDGYTLVEHSGNERGKFEVNPLTVTYYYLYNTKATVQYIDKITGQILEQSTTEGLEGDDFVTESKSFDNYILVEEPAQKTVKMTKDEIILKYYYARISAGVIEKHIDVISGEILSNDTHQGNEGDTYNIPSRTFQGYDLVEDRLPANAQGTMTVNPIEVVYYYIYKSKVTAQYVDKNTGEKLTEDEVQNGHEKDAYITDRKTFDDYKLVEVPTNADGEMTKKDITVTYNYVHTSGGVIVNHVDVNTNKQLLDETKQEGYEGDPYETHEENIPGYTLVKEKYPENAKGIMAREETRVTYYYVKNTEVNIKYIDKETGEEITEKTNIPGKEGENYTTEPKDIPGYDLVEEPANKDGTMTAEPIDVIYYYRRPAKVVVKYIDQETNEEIATEEKQEGHQNDEYTTEAKDIKYYKLIATPDNATGTMKVTVTKDENGKDIVEDTTYVTYYYRKLIFNLNIDKKVSSVTVNGEESIINGDLGKVEVHRKELNTAKVEVKYIIKVTNDSELTGKASILEDIPTGMIMNAEKNAGWEVKGTTATRETKELQPGESEEYLVVLDWENGENNIGMKENTASIISTENEAGFEEKDTTDNEDKADVIVAIGTGGHTYVLIAGGMLLILISLACGVYVKKKSSEE